MVVDRYAAYNKVPRAIQHLYAYLLREVQDLEKEFPDSSEVKAFVNTLTPLLSLAMGLRNQAISNREFRFKATRLKTQIVHTVRSPATHLGIQRIQDIFQEQAERIYHWAESRQVAAENNLAERDLRPTVIALKVSFGSQSDAGIPEGA